MGSTGSMAVAPDPVRRREAVLNYQAQGNGDVDRMLEQRAAWVDQQAKDFGVDANLIRAVVKYKSLREDFRPEPISAGSSQTRGDDTLGRTIKGAAVWLGEAKKRLQESGEGEPSNEQILDQYAAQRRSEHPDGAEGLRVMYRHFSGKEGKENPVDRRDERAMEKVAAPMPRPEPVAMSERRLAGQPEPRPAPTPRPELRREESANPPIGAGLMAKTAPPNPRPREENTQGERLVGRPRPSAAPTPRPEPKKSKPVSPAWHVRSGTLLIDPVRFRQGVEEAQAAGVITPEQAGFFLKNGQVIEDGALKQRQMVREAQKDPALKAVMAGTSRDRAMKQRGLMERMAGAAMGASTGLAAGYLLDRNISEHKGQLYDKANQRVRGWTEAYDKALADSHLQGHYDSESRLSYIIVDPSEEIGKGATGANSPAEWMIPEGNPENRAWKESFPKLADRQVQRDKAELAAAVYERDGGVAKKIVPAGYEAVSDKEVTGLGLDLKEFVDDESGFLARLYRNKHTGEYVVAYAGTDLSTLADLKADVANGLFGVETRQYEMAVSLANRVASKVGREHLSFVGHSLGGGLATAAALETQRPAVTFNAAALSERALAGYQTKSTRANELITAFYMPGEVVGELQALSTVIGPHLRYSTFGAMRPVGITQGRRIRLDGKWYHDPVTKHLMGDTLGSMAP